MSQEEIQYECCPCPMRLHTDNSPPVCSIRHARACRMHVSLPTGHCQETKRKVHCVTWGSPRVGDAAFREKYNAAVPHTARIFNKWDPVPCVPCGTWITAEPEENTGGRYMEAVVERLVEECSQRAGRLQQHLCGSGLEYEHVGQPVQLEIGNCERFSWWATKSTAALAFVQGQRDWKSWARAAQAVTQEIVAPHLLEAYEANLRHAYRGHKALDILVEIGENFHGLQTGISSLGEVARQIVLDRVDLTANAEKVVREFGYPKPESLAQRIMSPEGIGSVANCLAAANLAVSVVGTAGSWYGLYCVNAKMNRFESASAQRHEEVAGQLHHIVQELERLPGNVVSQLRFENLKDKVGKLKSAAKVLEENLALTRPPSWELMMASTDCMRRLTKFLLMRVVDDWLRSGQPLMAAPLVYSVLEGVCYAFLLELSVYRRAGQKETLAERSEQMWQDVKPRLEGLSLTFRRCNQLHQLAPSCVQLAREKPHFLEDVYKIDDFSNLVALVMKEGGIPQGPWDRLRSWLPLPAGPPARRDCIVVLWRELQAGLLLCVLGKSSASGCWKVAAGGVAHGEGVHPSSPN